MPRASTVLSVVGITTVVAVVGYAIWFDQKRRHDAEFRRQLRKYLLTLPSSLRILSRRTAHQVNLIRERPQKDRQVSQAGCF
jgi:hypothetical protein